MTAADPDPATTAAAADAETWAAAMAAGMQAQRDFRANNGNPEWDSDWDDEVEAILEAVWSHVAAYEHAEAEFEARAAERQRWAVKFREYADGEPQAAENGRIRAALLREVADLLDGDDGD